MPTEAAAPPRDRLTPSVDRAVSSMRFPQAGIAFLRIVVGVWFLKSLFTKIAIGLAWGVIPVPTASGRWMHVMPILLTKYAAENPILPYRAFLQHTVIPNAHIFAPFTALGEVAVGIGLTFGFLTVPAALFGAIQVIFYGLAVQHMSSGQQGFHVMLFAMMITFLFTRAGRFFGVDGWVRSRYPDSLYARLPLS